MCRFLDFKFIISTYYKPNSVIRYLLNCVKPQSFKRSSTQKPDEPEKIPMSDHFYQLCAETKYNWSVFIFPPWEYIYTKDRERKQDFALAQDTYFEMVRAYDEFGYSLIEMPLASVPERVEFILRKLKLGL